MTLEPLIGKGRATKVRHLDLEMMFVLHTCLVLSPTYNLAVKSKKKSLTKAERNSLPSDFADVQAAYAKFGDVANYYPFFWIEKYGADAIQGGFSAPSVRVISEIPAKRKLSLKNDGKDWVDFLKRLDHSIEEPADRLLVVIPKSISKSELVKKMLLLSDQYGFSNKSTKARIRHPDVKLRINTLHLSKLKDLYLAKLTNPKMEHWRLGANLKFSKKLCDGIDVNGGRHASTEIEQINRELLGKVVGRALGKFQRIIENAARGIYPSDRPVPTVQFDLDAIQKRWEMHEKYVNKVAAKQSRELLSSFEAEAKND